MPRAGHTPHYNVVNGITRNNRVRKFSFLSGRTFLLANILLSFVFCGGFLMINFTDTIPLRMVNASQYCDRLEYAIRTAPQPIGFLEIALPLTTFVVCGVATYARAIVHKCSSEKIIRRIVWVFWILFMHLVFLSSFLVALKLSFGALRPYFFAETDMKVRYCAPSLPKIEYSSFLLRYQEEELRTSFPSFRAGIYGFGIAFLYFYIDHLNHNIGVNAAQQFIMLVFGTLIWIQVLNLWQKGTNHLRDIIAGLFIGTVQGILANRGMFGTAFPQ